VVKNQSKTNWQRKIMTDKTKHNLSVIINAILTAICTILTTSSCINNLH